MGGFLHIAQKLHTQLTITARYQLPQSKTEKRKQEGGAEKSGISCMNV